MNNTQSRFQKDIRQDAWDDAVVNFGDAGRYLSRVFNKDFLAFLALCGATSLLTANADANIANENKSEGKPPAMKQMAYFLGRLIAFPVSKISKLLWRKKANSVADNDNSATDQVPRDGKAFEIVVSQDQENDEQKGEIPLNQVSCNKDFIIEQDDINESDDKAPFKQAPCNNLSPASDNSIEQKISDGIRFVAAVKLTSLWLDLGKGVSEVKAIGSAAWSISKGFFYSAKYLYLLGSDILGITSTEQQEEIKIAIDKETQEILLELLQSNYLRGAERCQNILNKAANGDENKMHNIDFMIEVLGEKLAIKFISLETPAPEEQKKEQQQDEIDKTLAPTEEQGQVLAGADESESVVAN